MLAEQPGWSSNGWMLPNVSFQYTMISILFRFIAEFISMRRYSAEGLYTIMGLYWLLPSTAIVKSVIVDKRLELFPLPVMLLLLLPMSLGN